MAKLNIFFFGEEQITGTDALYFYGIQGAIVAILTLLAAVTLFN